MGSTDLLHLILNSFVFVCFRGSATRHVPVLRRRSISFLIQRT